MPNKTLLQRRGIAAVVSLGFFIAAAIVAERAASQAQVETPAAPPAVQTPDTDESQAEGAPAPRAPEAPLETTGQLPTLDYEPTESISEDKSVSFPVDI